MLKLSSVLIVILAITFGFLYFADINGEINAEKMLYKGLKSYRKLQVNPEVAPAGMINRIEDIFGEVIDRYPESETAKTSRIKLLEIYFNHKKYDKAIALAEELIKKHPEDPVLLSRIQFIKIAAFELSENVDAALSELEILKQQYPDTPLGVQAPLYKALHFEKNKQINEATKAYREAAAYYENMAQERAGTIGGYVANLLLMQTHIKLKNYSEAGSLIEKIMEEYKAPQTIIQQLPYIEFVFVKKLNKPEKAIELYEDVKEMFDNEKMEKFLDGKIKEIKGGDKEVNN
jgi:tetratricopeptide (TPR) repeat protein